MSVTYLIRHAQLDVITIILKIYVSALFMSRNRGLNTVKNVSGIDKTKRCLTKKLDLFRSRMLKFFVILD